MMGFKMFLFVMLLIGVKGQENPLKECMEMVKYEGGSDSLVKLAVEEQLDATCENATRAIDCMNNVTRENIGYDVKELAAALEGTEMGKSLQLVVNIIDLTEELCTEGTQLRTDYLMDEECFRHLSIEALDQCHRKAEAASVIFRHVDTEDSFDHAVEEPCVIQAFKLGCLGADILDECGNHAFNTYNEMVKKIGFFKVGICPANIIRTVNTTVIDSLENLESRRSAYHTILSLEKRRK